MISFSVPEERVEDIAYYMEAVGTRAEDLYPVFDKILGKILERNLRMYETHGASSGVYWAPLAASTIAIKGGTTYHRQRTPKRYPYPERPLWREGELVRSLSERHHHLQKLDIGDDHLEIGTHHDAAPFHADGTTRMPRRPPLVIPKKHGQEYLKMLNDFIFGNDEYAR